MTFKIGNIKRDIQTTKKKEKEKSVVKKHNNRNESFSMWTQQHILDGKRINELEDSPIEIIQAEEQGGMWKKKELILRDLGDNDKCPN